MHLDRALGAFIGLAVGDALGVPLEFSQRDMHPVVREMIGGGPFDLAPGEWTDDTSMALCLADTLIANRELDENDLLRRFVSWWRTGENSVTGRFFDIGITTANSLAAYERNPQKFSGPEDPTAAGNGSLMRLAPVALFAGSDLELGMELADRQSRTTHPAPIAHDACRYFALLLMEGIAGRSKAELLQSRPWAGSAEVADIAAGAWKTKDRDEISSSGYVISTLEAALWAVEKCDNFEDALVLAVNLANDADTIGAVTGQLAGAIWGHSGIPGRWLEKLAWRDKIELKARELLNADESIYQS